MTQRKRRDPRSKATDRTGAGATGEIPPMDGPVDGREVSAAAALERARRHARAALAEAIAALRALLDAASLTAVGQPADRSAAFGIIASLLSEIEGLVSPSRPGDAPVTDAVVRSLLLAIDAEIERWEERSKRDPDARPVLRAFLGFREVLWEFGLRSEDSPSAPSAGERSPVHPEEAEANAETNPTAAHRKTARGRSVRNPAGGTRGRVQRIEVT